VVLHSRNSNRRGGSRRVEPKHTAPKTKPRRLGSRFFRPNRHLCCVLLDSKALERYQMACGRNYNKLASMFAIECIDKHVKFDDSSHRYTVYGNLVPRSATAVVTEFAGSPFDPDAIIAKYLPTWRRNTRSKYFDTIKGLNDADAATAIKATWKLATETGTALHKRLEALLNNEEEEDDTKTDAAWRPLKIAIDELHAAGWQPRRTELSLWWENEADTANNPDMPPNVTCAGQIDCVYSDGEDDIALIDLKCTEHNLRPNASSFGRMCKAPLDEHSANDFVKYSFQLSIYAVMFEQRTGLSIHPDKRWLLQSHGSFDLVRWQRCACLDAEARAVLNSF
jgi:hypothetical protein